MGTSSSPLGGAMVQGASKASSGWHYEWIAPRVVLHYSPNQLKHDSDAAIQISARKEQRQAASCNLRCAFTCGGNDKDNHSDPSEGGFEVQVNLPKCLRSLLVQDWELVIRGKKLCDLPAKVSIDAILSEYAIFPMNCHTRDKKYVVCGLVDVLKEYFNAILSTQLLYDFERPQYDELVVSYPSSQMCELYGGVHLLCLFQQLGPMLTCTSLDDSSLMVLLSHLEDFLEYLARDLYLLFIDAKDYVLASEEHLKVV
ncbi:mortality factor 4-like protein 2 [Trichosurus vulpecula]|uniref:mortality factor 4-like protein 2 n=1 Tax=Trichosurus vulpecula TaxID=9337 RepID=UPI00186B0252|nr:mortality factor 4-like protein 2 [Trichosurus vulpecula]